MSVDDLMARIDAARNRVREVREEALAATGGIKGIIAASLRLEWEASKVTYELKENHKAITESNRRAFRRAQERLLADPSHPLHHLLDSNGRLNGRYHAKPVGLQAGHTVTRNGLIQSLSGELETFALEEAIPNNYDSRAEGRGEVLRKTVLDIHGVPVERTTARILEGINLLDSNILAAAPERSGWTAPNSLFTESIPDAAGSSQLRSILRGGSRALGPLGAAVDLYHLGDAFVEDGGTIGENVKETAGGVAGGWAGAAAGAAIGTAVAGPVGTVVGGIIGGIAGGGLGESLGGLL